MITMSDDAYYALVRDLADLMPEKGEVSITMDAYSDVLSRHGIVPEEERVVARWFAEQFSKPGGTA